MRIIVFSDSHGNYAALRRVVREHENDGNIFLHLGDGEHEFHRLPEEFPNLKMHGVSGNCDWASTGTTTGLLHVMGKKIFYTHGHIFHVKASLEELCESARGLGAEIALFGHTHTALAEYDNGLYLFNPGSISASAGGASYGMLDITGAGIAANIVRL